MKAISVMVALVADQSTKSTEIEIEVTYEDGTVRSMKLPARRSVRFDLDALFSEDADARAAG